MKEFFGFGGFEREPEGWFSWQHITFVTSLMAVMVFLALFFAIRNKNKDEAVKNKVLVVSALLIDGLELFKIVINCFINKDPLDFLYNLPLFLCSIQLITLPLAAFSKGRLKETALDFVFIFGLLGAVLGTYAAGQNYSSYPVLSFPNVISGITHSISGFASLYIVTVGMASMKLKNIPFTFIILCSFCIVAYLANLILDYNYMFLMRGDGTPYDLLYNLVGGNPVLYPLGVLLLFLLWICAFYGVYYLIKRKKNGQTVA